MDNVPESGVDIASLVQGVNELPAGDDALDTGCEPCGEERVGGAEKGQPMLLYALLLVVVLCLVYYLRRKRQDAKKSDSSSKSKESLTGGGYTAVAV